MGKSAMFVVLGFTAVCSAMSVRAAAESADSFEALQELMQRAIPKQDLALTLTIDSVPGAPGEEVPVPVFIESQNAMPSVLTMFIEYDDSVVEFSGATLGGAVPEGKALTTMVNPRDPDDPEDETNVGIAVLGFDRNTIDNGTVLVVRFQVAADAGDATIPLLDAGFSSAARPGDDGVEPEAFAVTVEDGVIDLSCPSVPAPQGLTASSDQSTGILLAWNAVQGAEAYRVRRSDTPDLLDAAPVSEWQSETTFLDDTVEAPDPPALGCAPGAGPVYYYWVEARAREGCNSDLTGPVSGEVTARKDRFTEVLPLTQNPEGAPTRLDAAPVHMRLRGTRRAPDASVFAQVQRTGGAPVTLNWIPVSAPVFDGWLEIAPQEGAWRAGDRLTVTAWAEADSGALVASAKGAFADGAVPAGKPRAHPAAPDGAVAMSVVEGTPGAGPYRATLPLGTGTPAADIAVLAYDAPAGEWVPAARLAGLLQREPRLVRTSSGQWQLVAHLNHGAYLAAAPDPGAVQNASAWGDSLLLLIAVFGVSLVSRRIVRQFL